MAQPVVPGTLNGPIIDAGQAFSRVLPLAGLFVVGLIMPAAWTPAVVSVQCSLDGNYFYDLYERSGSLQRFSVVAGTVIPVNPQLFWMAQFIKIISGVPLQIPQTEARQFITITRTSLSSSQSDD
jgi:hypothetical protein